ncbi:MAG: outer membrane lipoprotein chaperone LolA [Rugosibacter sp.]|nr:outer membrane lipoprotein chaperone LolA [Rugosibacter sp.]
MSYWITRLLATIKGLSDNHGMKKLIYIVCAVCCAGFTPVSIASGLDQLKYFVAHTASARGTFSQSVASKSGRKPQLSSGSFSMQRPGRFRWSYEKPYPQLLVSDGVSLWSFDPELNQVAIKKVGTALGASPAGLLAGQDIEKNFVLKEAPSVDGVEFIEATSRTGEASFELVKIGFKANQPVSMEIHDSFGQISSLGFDRFEVNPSLAASLFRFTPPAGADVMKE